MTLVVFAARPGARRWVAILMGVLAWGWAIGASPALADPASVAPIQAVAGSTPFPGGCPPFSPEPGTENAQYEPYAVADPADPRRLVAAWIQDGGLSNIVGVSGDGGQTWKRVLVPGVSHCTGGNTGGAVDPWLAAGPDRTVYMVSLGADLSPGFPFTNPKTQVVVNRSTDAGSTWSPAVAVQPEDGGYYDKPSITADPKIPGKVYAVWETRSGLTGGTGVGMFAQTTDGGRSWSTPRMIYDPGPLQYPHGNVIAVLPDGTLLDVFGLLNNSPFASNTANVPDMEMAMRSSDGGRSWSSPITIASVPSRLPGKDDSAQQRLIALPLPSVAVDRAGTIYVAWHENPTPTAGRILLARSTDGGRTWSQPTTTAGPGAQAFLPSLAIEANGVLGLLWYDTRNDNAADNSHLTTDVWFAHSHDAGRTWEQTHVAGPFDAFAGPDFFNQGHEIGDYIDLIPAPGGFSAIFTQAQPATRVGATNVFFSQIHLRQQTAAPTSGTTLRRLSLTVRPHNIRSGKRTRLVFRVTTSTGPRRRTRGHRPIAGALIRVAGHHLHTSRSGRASLTHTFRRAGRYMITATKAGYQVARTTIRVRSRAGNADAD
jgi:hypothetical protein